MSNTADTAWMTMAVAERRDFVDFLTGLTSDQWNAATLCGRWRVRDVVAHVYSYDDLTPWGLITRFARGRFTFDGTNDAALSGAPRHPDQLLTHARAHPRPRGLTAGFSGRIALTDGIIHQQDIRRPLDLPRRIPPERLVVALDFARTAPAIHARRRIRGLRLVATDLDWSTGNGPAVTGTGEALLMALAGRSGVTDELSGPGVQALAARIRVRS